MTHRDKQKSHWFLLQSGLSFILIGSLTSLATEPDSSRESNIAEVAITEDDREHWSFKPIAHPPLPVVIASEWPTTAVDLFVLKDRERKQLPTPTLANRNVILRRLKFDLLGLPPTPDEVLAFEQDPAPDAYERLVDSILASPAYGERWAQYWLDLARFAETDGFEHDRVRSGAWKYRQWVVDALNDDMPYDEFVRSQLAGDLIGDGVDTIATMFCMAGPDMPDLNEQDLRRHDKMNEITSTVGSALLGLQMHCAQCHDHKYDAISQADFYRLRGVFEAAVPELTRDKPALGLKRVSEPVAPFVFLRGELTHPGPRVKARPPRIADWEHSNNDFDSIDPRLAFSNWLFNEKNPLTARVIANRVWQHHFGRALCENPSDFGVVAGGPWNPELLDWLAVELRDGGWSLKQLHRTIVCSSTYRMAERTEAFPRRRLDGETIRDALLAVSGSLCNEYGGESVRPPLPQELVETLLKGQWTESERFAEHSRRSIYVFARRNLRYPLFDVFDRPDAGASCALRSQSTTAIQSLQMLNSELTFQAASGLCDRLLEEETTDDDLILKLFLVAFSRRPTQAESNRLRDILGEQSSERRENLLVACVAMLNASEFIYLD